MLAIPDHNIQYKKSSLTHPNSIYRAIHIDSMQYYSAGKYRLNVSQIGSPVIDRAGSVRRVYLINARSPVNSHSNIVGKEGKYFLNEDMKGRLLGTNGVLINQAKEFVSRPPILDNEMTRTLRADILACIFENVGVEYIGGSLEFMANIVTRHAQN